MSPNEVKCEHCGCVIEDPDKAVVWKKGEETFRFCSGACKRTYEEIRRTREEVLREKTW